MSENKLTFNSMIKSMGLVFGDIGTSPIYTLTVVCLTLQVTKKCHKYFIAYYLDAFACWSPLKYTGLQ
jgi:K+ transporter